MITKKTPRSLLLTLGAAVVLIVGGVAAYWILGRRDVSTLPPGATLIPEDALMSVTVTTDPNQWQKLRELGTPETRAVINQQFKQLEAQFLTRKGYRYQTDIQPWVGDQVTLAFLPGSGDVATQQSLWVLPIEDLNRARQFFEAQAQGKMAERTYKGVKIWQRQSANPEQTAAAALLDRRFMVFATEPKVIDQVIDASRKGASLARVPRYKVALRSIQTSQPFAELYVNLPAVASRTNANSDQPISPEAIAKLQTAQGLASTVNLEADTIKFQSISWLKPDSKRKFQVINKAKQITSRLPANTLMMASGGDFKTFWQEYKQSSESTLAFPFNPNQFRASVQSTTGMDFDQAFAKWMNGEFAIALLPSQTKSSQGAGIALLAQTSDRKAAEKSFQQLDQVMKQRYNLKVNESKREDQTLTTLIVPPNLPVATHGWLAGNTAFLTLGSPVDKALLPKPSSAIEGTDLYQQVTRSDLNPVNGHFFVDMPRTLSLLESSPFLPKLSPNTLKFAQAIQSIGVTAAVKNEWSSRHDILVKLKKTGS